MDALIEYYMNNGYAKSEAQRTAYEILYGEDFDRETESEVNA